MSEIAKVPIESFKQGMKEQGALATHFKEEFNEYAENTAAQDQGLPVRRFSRVDLESVVPDCFDIIEWSEFSYYRPEALKHFAWLHSLKQEDLADTGMSQYLVLRRKA